MNLIKNFGMKFALILAVVFCAGLAKAQDASSVEISIPDTPIKSYERVYLPVNLTNETEVSALQFKMTLPESLEFDGKPMATDRLNKNTVTVSAKGAVLVQPNLDASPFKGNSGEIFSIPVKVKEGYLESGKTVQIQVSSITFSDPNSVATTQNPFSVNVSLDPFTFKATLEPSPLTILPGGEAKVSFCLENVYTASGEPAPVAGLTVDMTLPEGLSVDDNSIEATDRMEADADPIYYVNGTFMLTSMSDNILVKGISEGPIFTFTVKADKDFKGAEGTELKLENLLVSAVVGAFPVNGEVESCPVKAIPADVQAAYEKVIETIDAVESQYEEALAAAQKENPSFDFSEYTEIITKAISEAKEGAAQALAAAATEGEEFNFPFDGADIEAMINEMKNAPARAALVAANKAAYDKVIEAINAVKADYEEALAAVKEAYPDFDFAEYEEIITNAIKEANEGAAQALAAANDEGIEYDFKFDGEEIENMIKDMQAQPAREAANKAAYDKDIAALEDVEKAYDAAVAEIEKTYPDFDLTEWKEIISGQIKEQKDGAAQALAAATEEGVDYNYPFDNGEYILGMIEEMQKAAKADADQAALEAANLEACKAVLETIDALQTKYEDAVTEVRESNPEFDLTEWVEIIMGAINDARTGAEQALATANEDGEEYSFAFDGEEVENMINEMKTQAAREAANKAAYDKDIAALEDVEKAYDAAVAEIEKTYPDFDLTEWKEIISGQIKEQKDGAAQALAAANEDGVEYSYPFDNGEYILGMIEEMQNAAKADADQAALEAANLEACKAVLETIDALQTKYEDAVAGILDTNPEFDLTEWEEIIMGAINDARTGAEQALATANEDGEEYSFAFDGEEIDSMIAQMISESTPSAVDAIAAEAAAGKAFIFTLDGKKHSRPVVGEVNVIVRENSTTKIFIK